MQIDLNKVLAAVKPRPVAMTLDGTTYTLRRLTVADVRALGVAGTAQPGEAQLVANQRLIDQAATLFDAPPPPLTVKLAAFTDEEAQTDAWQAATAIYAAVNETYTEQRSKTYALAQEETIRQIDEQAAGAASSTT